MSSLWSDPIYRETVAIVAAFVFSVGLAIYFFRDRSPHMKAGWASVKSWLFAAPVILFIAGLPSIWTLLSLTVLALLGAKSFFQIMGMYHRTYFVWACYLGMIFLSYAIHRGWWGVYNVTPMFFLGFICTVPLMRNSYKHMIQYISLTLICFIFLGWGFLHLGKISSMESGAYLLIYIVILSEVCDNLNLALSRIFKSHFKPFNKITPRRSLAGFLISTILTLLLAWGLRHMLPIRTEVFWVAAGLSASLVGGFGDITMSVLRRDTGIKDVGAFILGRGDLLSRMDRLIFVAPVFYYSMSYLLANQ